MTLRVVFMGTPEFAVSSLDALVAAEDIEVPLVLTPPDAVRGRGRTPTPSPVKKRARELGIPVLETRRIDSDIIARLHAVAPDAIAVAAYGALLPDEILSTRVARLGVINVHGSLLPRWRGAAPIQRAILAGDDTVGISIMRIVHELDAGPWCRQVSLYVDDKDVSQLMAELAERGAQELVGALRDMDAGVAEWHEQDVRAVTYAQKIDKAELLLCPSESVDVNLRRVRASSDAAPAKARIGSRGVRIVAARAVAEDEVVYESVRACAPGQVLIIHNRIFFGCGDGALELMRVRPDGKREMPASAWASGLHTVLCWDVMQ